MIKEFSNLIGREAQLAITNQKWYSEMIPAYDDYLNAKIWDID